VKVAYIRRKEQVIIRKCILCCHSQCD